MRKLLLGLIGTLVLFIGTCVQEDILSLSKRALILAYGDSANAIGCQFRTWGSRELWLPYCDGRL